jgi:hypothetical protein
MNEIGSLPPLVIYGMNPRSTRYQSPQGRKRLIIPIGYFARVKQESPSFRLIEKIKFIDSLRNRINAGDLIGAQTRLNQAIKKKQFAPCEKLPLRQKKEQERAYGCFINFAQNMIDLYRL